MTRPYSAPSNSWSASRLRCALSSSMPSTTQICLQMAGSNSYDLLSPNFGNIASTIDGNRSIKFWLKYAF